MKLKRILAMLLACTMTACAFASCGDDDDDKDEKTTKSDKADDDEDEDEDDEEEDDEEETTKKKGKKDKDEEETTEAPDDDEDMDDVASSIGKACNSALIDLDENDEVLPCDMVVFCSDSFENLYFDEDDEEVDYDTIYDYMTYYFDDLDDYEFIIFLEETECTACFVSDSKNSKNVGLWSDEFDMDEVAEDIDVDEPTLSDIYDYLEEALGDVSGYDDEEKSEEDEVAYGVYWSAYWTCLSDMENAPDDALICSDEKKNIYDGDFDIADFNANFPDELEFEEIDDKIDDYEWVFCLNDDDIGFAAVAPDFDKTAVTIFTYDTDWETAFEGMTLQEIVDFFNET